MSKKLVRRDVDLAHLPPLTERQKSELDALAARPEGDIDYSEIPPLTAKFWTEAARGRFYKPIKTSTTVRIDADVLAWLRAQGKGYQSRINAILRREMLAATQNEGGGGFREEGRRGDKEPGVDQRRSDTRSGAGRERGDAGSGALRRRRGA
jgi:uncharacterized protein (DUF4415 family)